MYILDRARQIVALSLEDSEIVSTKQGTKHLIMQSRLMLMKPNFEKSKLSN